MNGRDTLRDAVRCLRETGRYVDEEGEATNALADLADNLPGLAPNLYPTHADNLAWAVSRWHAEVSQRPLVNVHRRTLDDTWRQVIRRFGGNPDELIGPDHDTLLAAGKAGVGAVPEGYEKMRGGKPVSYWRDNALEAAAQIAEAYPSPPGVAADIRAMKSAAGVALPLKTWQHDETGRITQTAECPGPRWTEVPAGVTGRDPLGQPGVDDGGPYNGLADEAGVTPCATEQECNQPKFCRQTGGCEKVEDREGWRPVAWMHEFTDPHTKERRQEPRLHQPKDYELLPGDVVTPLYFRSGTAGVALPDGSQR